MKHLMTKTGAIVGVIGLLALAGFFALSRILDAVPGAPSPISAFLHAKKNAVALPEQPASDAVTIGSASLLTPGYVVIYDDEEGPGKRMGVSARLPKGVTRDLEVKLEHPLAAGYYYAVLQREVGDVSYDAAKSETLRDAKGDVVMTRFLADPAPSSSGS